MPVAIRSWHDVEELLRARPQGAVLRVPKGTLPHPLTYGMVRTASVPVGQRAEWFRQGGLHVMDFGRHYHAQISAPAVERAVDPANALIGGCGAAGAALGAATRRTTGAVLAGALMGLLVGAAIAAAQAEDE